MARRSGFDGSLRALRAGELTFDEFVRKTRPRWREIAEKLSARWDLPTWVAVEDIEQEMLLACWKFAWRFDYTKSNREKIEQFSVWNALHAAIKVATKARLGSRPHRGEGHNVPSRYEIPISALHRERDEDGDREVEVSVAATQERDALRALILRNLVSRARGADRIALRALAARRGSIDAAAADLYGDRRAREQLKIGDGTEDVGVEDAGELRRLRIRGEDKAGSRLRAAIKRTAAA